MFKSGFLSYPRLKLFLILRCLINGSSNAIKAIPNAFGSPRQP